MAFTGVDALEITRRPSLEGDGVRPEWLFEIVHRVQVLVTASSRDAPTLDRLFADLPVESALEARLLGSLVARLCIEREKWAVRSETNSPSRAELSDKLLSHHRHAQAVAMVETFLRNDPSGHWTVEALARRSGCNRTDLETAFQARYSCCIHSYLIIRRIESAKSLIRRTAWRLEEVAKAVGYRGKASLFVNFRRMVGMTPDEYRRRWQPWVPSEKVSKRLSRLT